MSKKKKRQWMPIMRPRAGRTKSKIWPGEGESVGAWAERPDCPQRIPFMFFDDPAVREACDRNHDQTPETLAQRGGLSPQEAYAVLGGHSAAKVLDGTITEDEAVEYLRGLASVDEQKTE